MTFNEPDDDVENVALTPPSYLLFKKLIPLYGRDYDIIKRNLQYNLEGHALLGIKEDECDPLKSRLLNPIRIGGSYEDTRVPPLFLMSSSSGKQELIEATRLSCSEGVRYSPATSIHYEQLVGGFVWDDEKTKKQLRSVRGYMDDDHVTFDEVNLYLTAKDRDSIQFRAYVKQGLNPYGKNLLQKRRTGIGYKDRLTYFPRFSPAFFGQPCRAPLELITEGFLRRTLVTYLEPSLEQKLEAFNDTFLEPVEDVNEAWGKWRNHLGALRHGAPYIDWYLSPEFLNFLRQNVRRVVLTTCQEQPKLRNFATIMLHPLKWRLAKFACINAADRRFWHNPFILNTNPSNPTRVQIAVTIEDGKVACADLERSWAQTLEFVNKYCVGNYTDDKVNVKNRILRLLCDKKAFSEETGLQVKDCIQIVSDQTGVPQATVRVYYLALKNDGTVVYRQVGRNKTSVYLSDSKICDSTLAE